MQATPHDAMHKMQIFIVVAVSRRWVGDTVLTFNVDSENKYRCTMDQKLADTVAYALGRMTSRPPSWTYDVISKIGLGSIKKYMPPLGDVLKNVFYN